MPSTGPDRRRPVRGVRGRRRSRRVGPPGTAERAASWEERYDLPFPLLADPSTDVSEEYDQPTRFGALGSLSDFVGRMPLAVVFDARDDEPSIAATYEGSTPGDRPDVDDLLAAVEDPGTTSL